MVALRYSCHRVLIGGALACLFFCALCPPRAVAKGEKPPFVYGIRPLAMGDAFTAVADDFNLLFYNPAGLAVLEGSETYIIHLGAKIDRRSYGDLTYILDLSDADGLDPDNITQQEIDRIVRCRIAGGLNLFRSGHIRKNQGAAVYLPVDVSVALKPGLIIPDAELLVLYDLISSYSYAHGLETPRGTFCFGGTLRIIKRTRWYENQSVIEMVDTFEDIDIYDRLTKSYWGVSTDIGFLWKKSDKTSFAFVANDLLCRLRGDWKRPNFKLGYARRFDIDSGWMWEGLLLAVDWVNIIGDEERVPLWRKKLSKQSFQDSLPIFAKRLRIGLESRFMKVFDVRCGLHQGYPTIGWGLDAAFFHLHYAFYGREYGVFPGDEPHFFHQAEVFFAF